VLQGNCQGVRRLIRRLPARLLASVLAASLAGAAITAGWSFVFCAPMAEARMHCCCPTPSRTADTIARACCDERSVPALPGAETAADGPPETVAAPLLAVLPLSSLLGGLPGDEARLGATLREARAGPAERLHRANSVFLL
jgi:hypothetical protein